LMEKMKREEGEKGFVFGIEFKGDEKRIQGGGFCKMERVRWLLAGHGDGRGV